MVFALLVCFGVEMTRAQQPAINPKRMVQSFDFEDTNDQGVLLGRGLDLPPAWYPMGRAPQSSDPNFDLLALHDRLSRRGGFPQHNRVGYSQARESASGEYSLHLSLDGGSAGAYIEVGALPAVPGSDYLITAKVRTHQLEHAGGRVRTYFVDKAGRRIETSVRETRRLRTKGIWTDIDLTLPGEFREAAYIGIEVELVQPNPDPHSLLGGQQIVLSDVKGDAWFDDIAVWQLPHVEIRTASPVNVTRSSAGPFWNISVRDLVGGELDSLVKVYDHQLNLVAEERRPMGWGAPSEWRYTPTLPGFGWYLAELAVVQPDEASPGKEQILARTYNAVLWLPPNGKVSGPDAERFALVATDLNPRQLKLMAELSGTVGLGTVIVSAWDRETTLNTLDLRLEALQQTILPIKNTGRRVELSFAPVPEELEHTRGVNTRLAAGVFAAPQEIWMPYVQPILVKQGQRVNTWHIGSIDQSEAAYRPDLGQTLAQLQRVFRRWTPAPQLGVPWRMDQPGRNDLPTPGDGLTYTVQWPAGITPDRLTETMANGDGWTAKSTPRRLHYQPPAADVMPRQARVTDLALRMVAAWEQEATGVALPDMWTKSLERREALLPDPLLGVAANVAARLSGFRAIGRLNLGDDRVAVVFEKIARDEHDTDPTIGDGLLVAWNVKAPADRAKLELFLGNRSPVVHDVWGNTTTLTKNQKNKHTVELTDTPIFITGIDPKLAMFRSGFVLDQPFISSTQTPHVRTIELTNPWSVTISGRFNITDPDGWTIKPQYHSFSLGPGRTVKMPIALKFPVNEVAGLKHLTAEIEFTADRRYEIELETPLELGLEGVRFEPALTLEPGTDRQTGEPAGVDAAVTCIITNTGSEQISLNVFAILPGHARKERLISRLEPGQAVIRQFRFPDAGGSLAQNDIRLGVRETNGPAVLNKLVGVNDVE